MGMSDRKALCIESQLSSLSFTSTVYPISQHFQSTDVPLPVTDRCTASQDATRLVRLFAKAHPERICLLKRLSQIGVTGQQVGIPPICHVAHIIPERVLEPVERKPRIHLDFKAAKAGHLGRPDNAQPASKHGRIWEDESMVHEIQLQSFCAQLLACYGKRWRVRCHDLDV